MAQISVLMTARDGLHTRPAALLVQEAKRFQCEIVLEAGGKASNAKSLFKLQLLEIVQGTEVGIRAEGADADAAVKHLADFLQGLQ